MARVSEGEGSKITESEAKSMRKIGGAILEVVSSFFSKFTRRKSVGNPDNFVWIDGDDSEDMDEHKPMFYEGDRVHIYNPHTGEFYAEDSDTIAPRKYEITDVKYDDEQGVFRYRLKNGKPNDWYSEDWLSLPIHTDFIREWVPKAIDEPTPEMVEAERNILSKALDDMARDKAIDYCLDILTHGSPEEMAEAERMLTELTGGKKAE